MSPEEEAFENWYATDGWFYASGTKEDSRSVWLAACRWMASVRNPTGEPIASANQLSDWATNG